MTAPVIMQEADNDQSVSRTMSFIMSPSKFTELSQLPAASDQNIRLVEQSNAEKLACITFNMSMSNERNEAKERELRQACERDGIRLSANRSDVKYFGYNAPFTIPYFRRNEISIPIVEQ